MPNKRRSKDPHYVKVTALKNQVSGRCQNPDCRFEVSSTGPLTSAKERSVRADAAWHEEHSR